MEMIRASMWVGLSAGGFFGVPKQLAAVSWIEIRPVFWRVGGMRARVFCEGKVMFKMDCVLLQ